VKLAWNCSEVDCEDRTVAIERFDAQSMSDFMQFLTLHAESHGLSVNPQRIINWVSSGYTWWKCECGEQVYGELFEKSMKQLSAHLKYKYHPRCPYCHQITLPLPHIYRVFAMPLCMCGRIQPKISAVGGETE
jgi:hypothetical protein